MISVRCGIRRLRLRLAARIAGGQLWLYEGCKPSREWVKGEIIVTPEGFAAMRAAFWTGATTRAHTALSTTNPTVEGRTGNGGNKP
jgi:hypothetical protein